MVLGMVLLLREREKNKKIFGRHGWLYKDHYFSRNIIKEVGEALFFSKKG